MVGAKGVKDTRRTEPTESPKLAHGGPKTACACTMSSANTVWLLASCFCGLLTVGVCLTLACPWDPFPPPTGWLLPSLIQDFEPSPIIICYAVFS